MDDLLRELERWVNLSRRAWGSIEVCPVESRDRNEHIDIWWDACEGVLEGKLTYDKLKPRKGACQ